LTSAATPVVARGGRSRILVTDGETRAALATVRALGAAGHDVHVVAAGARCLAGASRFASGEHSLADPATDPRGWSEGLERLARTLGADLLFPVSEISLATIYAYQLETRWPVVCPEREAYEAATDKHALLERAAALGIAVPRTRLVENPEALDTLPDPFRYPVVLKARRSRFLLDGRWRSGEIQIVGSAAELLVARSAPGLKGGLLLQEFIPGHGEGVFLLASQGRTLVRFAHRRLREKPPTGGVSVLSESIQPEPELLRQSEALLADLAWTGVAMVEFRRTPDGHAVLMEINPRLWGSLQLAIHAGVDFPSLMLALRRGEPIPAVEARIGVRMRWLLGDIDHLYISLRRSDVRRITGKSIPALLREFLASFADGSKSDVLDPSDWRPFWREWVAWIRG
jgi:predicted ATP-grasp superfamily ATP-dependent carboligase